MVVARIAEAVPAFFGPRVGAIAMQPAVIELGGHRQMPHTADEGVLKCTVIGPLGEDFIDGGRVEFGLAVVLFGHRSAVPLPPSIEAPEDKLEDAMIAEFAFGSARGHGEVRHEKLLKLGGREWDGKRRGGGLLCECGHGGIGSYEDGYGDRLNRFSSYVPID